MHFLRRVVSATAQAAGLLLATGCGSTVQEDRSINYTTDGSGIAFQHGDEGVFVAGGDGQELEKVFETDELTIAVSSPLWSPVDRRLIFSAARPAASDRDQPITGPGTWDANPEGRQFGPQEVVYTCMLRPAPERDEPLAPVALFEATCDHPGYIAANLAVRWHPSGDRILFVDSTLPGQHSLFEFDLATKVRRQILPRSAAALIFDYTPQGSCLVCILAGGEGSPETDGIWICPTESEDWWQVPQSSRFAEASSTAILEHLRSTRPAWTKDETRFAFVTSNDISGSNPPSPKHAILTADTATRQVERLYESPAPLRDLHYCPRTGRLGFIEESDPVSLRTVGGDDGTSTEINRGDVRLFVGWNRDGSRLAYIVPEPTRDSSQWMYLFPPVPGARDRGYVADGSGDAPAELVHSGVRITFPQWSPTEDKLSLWGTYTPTHQSLIAAFLPWALRPGDPAAILDGHSGELTWMAVNAHEQSQVGHYYLSRREYEEAWKWYERAAVGRAPARPVKLSEIDQFLRGNRIHLDPAFFEYYCLKKLGRDMQAAELLKQFRIATGFEVDTEAMDGFAQQWLGQEEQAREELDKLIAFAVPLIRSAYITEVFLSLDAAQDGIAFFEDELKSASSDHERLVAQLCLSQLLLFASDYDAYAELATSRLAPQLLDRIESPAHVQAIDHSHLSEMRRSLESYTTLVAATAALRPLTSQAFLQNYSESQLREMLSSWRAQEQRVRQDVQRLQVDAVLAALLKRLGDAEYPTIEARLKANPLFGTFEFDFAGGAQ